MHLPFDVWVWLECDDYDADPPAGQRNSRGLVSAVTAARILDADGCENAFLRIDERAARIIAEAPAMLALALYAAARGEGDADMARGILARLGYCAVCRKDRANEVDCSCGMNARRP